MYLIKNFEFKNRPIKKKTEKRVKKENYYERIQEQAYKYKNCLFVNADNVSSLQIAKLRSRLREIGAYMIMGKNPQHVQFKFELVVFNI